ncbi:MAG: hypothetical protein HUJ93_03830 [Bacteroidales bacterium]|nr:hypothetical protein [Bacteroidales bacterium]
MKKIDFKKNIFPLIVIVAVFVIAAIVYCKPVLKGMVIGTGDHINGFSAVQESLRYTEQTGNYSWWNGAVFSGMPNYQIGGGRYKSSEVIGVFQDFFHKGHDNAIFTVIFYLLAFFILLRAFGVERKLAAAGAFAIAFSSYFMIIIGAAHGGKTSSISWMTLVLVGMLLTYRKKYGWGCVMTMFFMSMGYTPHPQMAYYVCLLIGVIFCAEFYIHIEEKRMKEWAVATVLFVASLAVGFGTNMGNTFANQEYMTQTMRGGHSDLVREGEESPASGLDLEYATSWSYGIDETLTFLIPNFMGGSSAYDAGTGSQLYKELINNGAAPAVAREFCSSAPMYWGDQAFTAGPVYIGAIVFLLFILGLMIVKGPYKWALLVATLFSVFLSWGYHFMPLTKLFFNYFPLYNKFRAVSSILIVAEITMPLLGFLAIREIWEKKIPVAELLK